MSTVISAINSVARTQDGLKPSNARWLCGWCHMSVFGRLGDRGHRRQSVARSYLAWTCRGAALSGDIRLFALICSVGLPPSSGRVPRR
jgi:hypothetical protein